MMFKLFCQLKLLFKTELGVLSLLREKDFIQFPVIVFRHLSGFQFSGHITTTKEILQYEQMLKTLLILVIPSFSFAFSLEVALS